MYGKFDNYFNKENKSFHNSIWIELIGFDKDAEDYGVEEYIKTIGFVPDSVSLHLTSINFVNTHKGMETEYVLPPYACSYGGHPQNDLRFRQDWTNYNLRSLISTLQGNGIKVFASFFDLVDENDDFCLKHPEILAKSTDSDSPEKGIMMIKRFADGSFYEDYLKNMLIKTVNDYGFDGVQLADGISCPRNAIWFADFSDDIIEQSGLNIPDGTDKIKYIQTEKRCEWINFYRNRWNSFLAKIINSLKHNGTLVAVNSAWTRDPVEALYRYGADYKFIDSLGVDYFIVEDVSSDLAILATEDNHGYKFSYDERKMLHYEFVANLMAINAHTKNMKITPLFMIWDNQEQWNVIHHAPTAMQRAAAANFSHFCVKDGNLSPVTDGPHFCLGDALTSDDWKFIRLSIDNAYVSDAIKTEGATFIWSNKKSERELELFIEKGLWHSAKWLANILRYGGAVHAVANIEDIENVSGDIAVANYSLLDNSEKAVIDGYNKGRVITVEYTNMPECKNILTPNAPGWPRPLKFGDVPFEYICNCVDIINKNANAKIIFEKEECNITEVVTGENSSVIFVENNEYYYSLPLVETKRKIKKIKIITKPDGYPLKYTENTFKVRVPGRGIDIAYIEYEKNL
mgnify:CR=1 FL=1